MSTMLPLAELKAAIQDGAKPSRGARKRDKHTERFQGTRLMFNLGAFAGGLAQGIRSGQEMQIKGRTADRLAQTADREAEMHQFRIDKAAFEKDKRSRLNAANEEIAAGWGKAGQPGTDKSGVSASTGLKELASLEGTQEPQALSASPANESRPYDLMGQ